MQWPRLQLLGNLNDGRGAPDDRPTPAGGVTLPGGLNSTAAAQKTETPDGEIRRQYGVFSSGSSGLRYDIKKLSMGQWDWAWSSGGS